MRSDEGYAPFILFYGPWNCGEFVLHQIYPDPSHIIVEIFLPVEPFEVKVEQFSVVFIQLPPQCLHIVVREVPVAGTEIGYYVNELIDLLVDL
jgi:hypothetical protein